jgi:hypothetical protein
MRIAGCPPAFRFTRCVSVAYTTYIATEVQLRASA